MKLDKKYLKNLINEVLDEATKRDFLKGAFGLGTMGALGAKVSDLNVGESEKMAAMSEEDKENLFRRGSEIPVSSAAAKQALDKLRIVPDLEFYAMAPAFDKAMGVDYAYASMPMIDEFYGNDPEMSMDIEDVEYFYDTWTSTQVYKYVFGQLAFWGTYRDEEDVMSRQMAPTVPSTDQWDRPTEMPILPLAWTVSMEVFLEKFLQLELNLEQYPEMREYILMKEGLTEDRYDEMKGHYEGLLGATNSGGFIQNPNHKKEKK